MKTIKFNNGLFTVLEFDKDSITIQRQTEPKIEVFGYLKNNTIKLMGWRNYVKFKILD